MPAETAARVVHASRRRLSRERRQRTNYRIAIVAYMLVWIGGGIAIEWPSTSKCLGSPQQAPMLSGAFGASASDRGMLEAAKGCLLEPALDLFLWTLAGTAIGVVVYYLLRRPR